MTYLLDVNVILALVDPAHVFHDTAHDWFRDIGQSSWATCPITENGAIRIFGGVRYPEGPGTPGSAAAVIRGLKLHPAHQFWSNDISLLSATHVRTDVIGTAAQVTDTYLLALAVHRQGKLATFDRRLSAAAVQGGSESLHIIG